MTVARGSGPSSSPGPLAKTNSTNGKFSSNDELGRRRAQHDARQLIEYLRFQLAAFDDGRFDLEGIAWEVGLIGARLGAMASRGELRVAS